MRENTDQENAVFRHFSRSGVTWAALKQYFMAKSSLRGRVLVTYLKEDYFEKPCKLTNSGINEQRDEQSEGKTDVFLQNPYGYCTGLLKTKISSETF